ncbi:hypothetical protein [Leptospira sp. GIMC2001]|uniref:hypothetical protein n=1 Tax=Leptospira sp. GIMC2001 TaxID=1513297 RepID=UPI002349DC65|nr:hypothetical protein [Leptospira sp. GIMC2001]WCL50585.1 hypothetical protein O4O04_07140 [Leptospira sp. GIMC2001]
MGKFDHSAVINEFFYYLHSFLCFRLFYFWNPLEIAVFISIMKAAIFLFLALSTSIIAEIENNSSIDDQEIRIFFHCNTNPKVAEATIQTYIQPIREVIESEKGKVLYFPFLHDSEISDWKNYVNSQRYQIEFSQESYHHWESQTSDRSRFVFLKEAIPNNYRFLGKLNLIHCPSEINKIGSLRLVLRSGNIIRKNLEYIKLNRWLGEF